MGELAGRVAILTGASGGIGSAVAETLGRHGARLVLAGRRAEPLDRLKEGLPQGQVLCVPCDVTRPSDLDRLVRAAETEFGRVDILVNGAGVSSQHPFWEQPLEDIEKLFYTNFYSYVALSRLVVPKMKEAGGGHVVNISSGSVMVEPPPNNFVVYTSLKVALRSFAKGLFWEMRDYGIKVTSIFPGVTHTPLTDGLRNVTQDESRLCSTDSVARTVLFALTQEDNSNPLELAVINQRTPWTRPTIPFQQKHPEK